MKYTYYTTEDFILDEYFQEWVKKPNKETDLFWQDWLEENPDKKDIIEDARQAIRELNFKQDLPFEGAYEQVWFEINKVNEKYDRQQKCKSFPGNLLRNWFKVAAVFAGVLITSLCIFYVINNSGNMEHKTGYGETATIILPDGSTVVLNANSKLRYAPQWRDKTTRQVWLEGEAFFTVTHTKAHQKFIVHTTEDFHVEVLGTQFNVYQRKKNTRVVLKHGKVKLNIQQEDAQAQVEMKPGELVEVRDRQEGYIKKAVNAELFSAWTQKELIFSDTPVSEIIPILEENYGLSVELDDKTLLQRKISGSVPSDNLQSLLFALSESLNYQIIQESNKIIFKSRSSK